ncbi:MAG: adenylate cyclase, partial [Vicinamibacteria bacterium]
LNQLCERPLIDKHRYVEHHVGRAWEIDVFHGENEGLVIAEVELPSAEAKVELPNWVGREVSDDPRYFNSNLLKNPYSAWSKT